MTITTRPRAQGRTDRPAHAHTFRRARATTYTRILTCVGRASDAETHVCVENPEAHPALAPARPSPPAAPHGPTEARIAQERAGAHTL